MNVVETVVPKVRGQQADRPENVSWRQEHGLWIPSPDASDTERAAYLEWRDSWAVTETLGVATGLRTILERAGTLGEIVVVALGLNAGEQGAWTHLSMSEVVTAASALSSAQDEMERNETWTAGPVLPALRRSFAAAALGGEMWVGPMVASPAATPQR
jgi:hypothetical protein